MKEQRKINPRVTCYLAGVVNKGAKSTVWTIGKNDQKIPIKKS